MGIALLAAAAPTFPAVNAFQGPQARMRTTGAAVAAERRTPSPPPSALYLSDIPKEPTEEERRRSNAGKSWRLNFKLPPPPEDQVVLTGDLLSLFVYAFSDHFVADLNAYLAGAAPGQPYHAGAADLYAAATSAAGTTSDGIVLKAPVWLDVTHGYRDHVLHVLLADQTVTQYSPVLQPAGLAACLLSAAWLVSGWLHRAFMFRNTLDCPADKALTVTARTWVTTCAVLLAGVAASNAVLLNDSEWWHTFKKGDVDYILDSLTVLAFWRFLVSSMLGSGGSGSGDSEE